MSTSAPARHRKKKTEVERDTAEHSRKAEESSDSDGSSSSSGLGLDSASGSGSGSDDSDSKDSDGDDSDSSDEKQVVKQRTNARVKVDEESDSESDEEDEDDDQGDNVEEEGFGHAHAKERATEQKETTPSEEGHRQVLESKHEKDTVGAPVRIPTETKKKVTSDAKQDGEERAKEPRIQLKTTRVATGQMVEDAAHSESEGETVRTQGETKPPHKTKAERTKAKDEKRGGKTTTAKRKMPDENAMDVDEENNTAPTNTTKMGAKALKDKKTSDSKAPKPAAKKRPTASVEDVTDDEATPPKARKPKPVPKPAAKKHRPAASVEDVTDDEATPPRKTRKGKAKAKESKSPKAETKKPKREKAMAADKNANDMDAAERQVRIDENLKEAFLGVSKLNIGAPSGGQVKLTWGDVNNRPLNRMHVAGLKRSIREGKQASRYTVYATIKRSWINVKSLSQRGEAYADLKEPKFTDEGLGESVSVLSGHHRQQALEGLTGEYKVNLDKSKIELGNAQKLLKKADDENEKLAEQAKLMQNTFDRLTALHKETGMWAVEWYDEDILTDESRAHLSENADFPSMPADEQEKAHMLMWLVRSTAVQWARKTGQKQLPGPGSDVWEPEIIKNAVTDTQAKNGSINFLIKHRVQYELYSMALEYPYFCSSGNLSLDQLSEAMQTPGNRNLKSVRTLGTFWAWMFRQGLTQMNMIANSRTFPDVEDTDDEESIPLHNLLVLLDNENIGNLRISKAAWVSAVGAKKRKNATEVQLMKAHKAQLEYSPGQYTAFEDGMKALDAEFIPDVFSRDILEEVDSIYDDVFGEWETEERDAHMLDSSSPVFQEKMKQYDREVTAKLKAMWRDVRRTGATLTDAEMSAFKNAEDKLDWIMLLRRRGHYPSIPFPTRMFIVDSLERLKTPDKGFQAVCRLVDPLCDSIIRRTTDMGTGDVWDYVGYMLHYLGKRNPLHLFKSASHDAENDLCVWILANMRLLNAATNCLNKYEDETVDKFITLTNANWIDPMKSQKMGLG
ncbi:hypothetical protein V8D89_010608, partial [Ganoderma adspersum]